MSENAIESGSTISRSELEINSDKCLLCSAESDIGTITVRYHKIFSEHYCQKCYNVKKNSKESKHV